MPTSGEFDAFEISAARKEMLHRKAAIVVAMPEWRAENWEKLNIADRWKVLDRTEKAFADLEQRDALPVSPLRADLINQCKEAGIEPPLGLTREARGNPLGIEIHPDLVSEKAPDRVMQTYFHEDHHVEQMQAIRSLESRPEFSTRQIDAWDLDRNIERVSQHLRDIPHEEYKNYAHEQSATLDSLRLYTMYLNKLAEQARDNAEQELALERIEREQAREHEPEHKGFER